MSHIVKKSQVKTNNFTNISTNLVCKEPILKDDGYKNKINLPLYSQNKDKFFDSNPMIVTRRNISTAQNKKHQHQDDQQDLIFTTSTCLKKKQELPTYNSHFSKTVKQSFKKNQRPQSKQQPRSKGWNNPQLMIKSSITVNDRPQTSKGQRPKPLYKSKVQEVSKRKTSLGNQQSKINEIDAIDAIGNSSKICKNSKLFFKTSIDSEFLSLFAN